MTFVFQTKQQKASQKLQKLSQFEILGTIN